MSTRITDNTKMAIKKIPTQSGNEMPSLLYGTAWKKDATTALVTKALKYGYRGIDTACQPKHYNESGVGEAVRQALKTGLNRSDLYIQTKFTPINGQDPQTIPYDKNAPIDVQVAQSFEISKKNLGVSYLDGLILHSPFENMDDTLLAWKAMEKICQDGGAKLIGISNCYHLKSLAKIYDEAAIKPSVVQNRFYRDTNYDKNIRLWCKEKNIIYQGFWTITANPHILSSNSVQQAAQTYHKTPAQILFHVLTKCGIVPLTGTTSDKHMQEDLDIFNFDLSASIVEEISALFN